MKTRHLLAVPLIAALACLGLRAADTMPANTLTPKEKAEGWKLLFDGKSLDGWHVWKREGTKGWEAKDGAVCLDKPGSGDLVTDGKFSNFEFSVDWKFDKGGNSGIIYRVGNVGGQTWNTGPEMQIENDSPKAKLGKNATGSLYDVFAPTSNTLKPLTQWNTFKVVAIGKHFEQWVNGVKVVETDVGSEDWNQKITKSKWKGSKEFASMPVGHIALQDHGAKICFRNLKIREVPAPADAK